jgi:hypothetical protein
VRSQPRGACLPGGGTRKERGMVRPCPRTDTEYELEFNRHGAAPGFDRYYRHYRCFSAWDLERTKVEDQMR